METFFLYAFLSCDYGSVAKPAWLLVMQMQI
jgi:hypothetical protein